MILQCGDSDGINGRDVIEQYLLELLLGCYALKIMYSFKWWIKCHKMISFP